MTDEQKSKAAFVDALNSALISCGDGRYDFLRENPLAYEVVGPEEYVRSGGSAACVTGDSLKALMADLAESSVI